MKSWLKFFGLSFFSDKIAKEARIRGVLNCVLGFVLALVFIFCGVLAANTVTFYTHYGNAARFKNFVYAAIEKNGLTVKDGLVASEKVINTYTSEADAEKYAQNGYNLVVDTRPSDALDDFEAYCVPKRGEVDEISYEQYLALSDEAKGNYDFKIRYTANELVLTDGLTAEHEKYLSSSENEDIKKQYSELVADKAKLTAKEYRRSVYALYVKAYYPGMSAYERAGEVPLLRSFYYRSYLYSSKTQKSLFVFDDVLFGYFNTDAGLEVTFYGSYGGYPSGEVTAEDADGFIKSAFGASVSLSVNVYLMNMFRLIPLIAVIPLLLALIAKIALSVFKDIKFKKYSTCLKIEFSYLAAGALITALVLFVCGYFVSSAALNSLPLIVLSAVLLIRTVIFIAGEYFTVRKANAQEPAGDEAEKK